MLILGIVISVVFLMVAPAAAHPPAGIVMSYDPGAEKLTVTITHNVDDPATHYIKKVQVKKNGLVISDPDYKSQPAKDSFTYTYDVKAAPGDTFRVIATCSLAGNLERVYDVTAPVVATATMESPAIIPAETVPHSVPTQQSPAGIIPFLGLAAFLLMRRA